MTLSAGPEADTYIHAFELNMTVRSRTFWLVLTTTHGSPPDHVAGRSNGRVCGNAQEQAGYCMTYDLIGMSSSLLLSFLCLLPPYNRDWDKGRQSVHASLPKPQRTPPDVGAGAAYTQTPTLRIPIPIDKRRQNSICNSVITDGDQPTWVPFGIRICMSLCPMSIQALGTKRVAQQCPDGAHMVNPLASNMHAYIHDECFPRFPDVVLWSPRD